MVQKALCLSLGQNHTVSSKFNNTRGRWKSDRAHFADDEVYFENEDEYNDDEYPAYDDDDGTMLEYDGDDACWQDDEWDVQSVFDTEEFDRVYAAYAGSKCQLNQMRVSRGFFPVVALTDGGQRIHVNASGSNSP